MIPRVVTRGTALAALLSVAIARETDHTAEATVQLNVRTMHAAALSTARSASDAVDAPYLLVSTLGPRDTRAASRLNADSAHRMIRLDQALSPQPLSTLRLQPGDSVRVLVSLMEGDSRAGAADDAAANASLTALASASAQRVTDLQRALAPLASRGDHWLGSAMLLVTNEGGKTYWRTLDCLASCKVLSRPTSPELAAAPTAGVLELTGAGATYHMQLSGQRAPN
jgi:hypothetical protein